MIVHIDIKGKKYTTDLSKPIDISIPLQAGNNNPIAWYLGPVEIAPVINEHFIGDVNRGGAVNFRNISFNPHGHGTHTECVGHISKEFYSINKELKRFFFVAELITVIPVSLENGDKVITAALLNEKWNKQANAAEAIVIRTQPNEEIKKTLHYSNTNPPYLTTDAAEWINARGIEHLLIDLPSVDREQDDGKLAAHHIFWQYPQQTQPHKTITELIYVPNTVLDGTYLLNLQIASFDNDASPSKPVLYPFFP